MRHGQEQCSHHSRTSPLSFQGTRRPHNLINRMEMVTSTTRNLSTAVKEVMYGTCSQMGDGDGGQRPEGVAMDQNPPAMFVADAPGLDFLNSIATPVDTPVDWIDNGEGLLNWLEQAQFVPADALKSIRAQALPGELDKVADQARSLRERFRGFVREHQGRPLTAHARRTSLADRRGAGTVCLHRGFFKREGLRRAGLHAPVCRPHARPRATLVQHGAVRKSSEAGRSPPSAQGAATLDPVPAPPITPTVLTGSSSAQRSAGC